MSDSVSIFSDLNMSDSHGSCPGAFLEFPVVMGAAEVPPSPTSQQTISQPPIASSIPGFLQKKKSAAKKISAAATGLPPPSTTVVTKQDKKNPTTVLILQSVPLPGPEGAWKHVVIQKLLPTPDGAQLIVILGEGTMPVSGDKKQASRSEQQQEQAVGAIISYKIYADITSVRVSNDNSCIRKLTSREELVVGTCFVPPDNTHSLLGTALKSGEVWLLKTLDLSVVSVIKRPGSELRVTAISYVSSKWPGFILFFHIMLLYP